MATYELAARRASKSSWAKLLSFLEMSKDKLSTAISSNHQHLAAVLIDWTNSYHFPTTQIKGSTPFPFQTSFLPFPVFLSFLFDPTLVLSSSSLSFLVPSSYFYLKGHLFSVLVVGIPPPTPSKTSTFVPTLSSPYVIQKIFHTRIFKSYEANICAFKCKTGAHQTERDWS